MLGSFLMTFFSRSAALLLTACASLLVGCANPGPPKPPSLQIPAAVTNLSAERRGNLVELHFTLPLRTSDGLTQKPGLISARVCRAVGTGICKPVAGMSGSFMVPGSSKTQSALQDALANDLSSGPPRLLTYRLELFSASGKSAGYSNPAFAAAGRSPQTVEGLHAEGSRLGVVLRWQAADPQAEVLLVREDLKTNSGSASGQTGTERKPGKFDFDGIRKVKLPPAVVTLSANSKENSGAANRALASATLDTSAITEEPYRYTAERKQTVDLDGHKLELWSVASPAVAFMLRDNFPPPPPTNLSVAGFHESFTQGKSLTYAVDLIWESVQDDQLAGYRVYRADLSLAISGRGSLLTSVPVTLPAFHDITASGSIRYRYSVTSIDLKGNESEAITAVLEPQMF